MAIVIPDTALAIVSGQNLGQPWVNVHALKFRSPTIIAQSTVDDFRSIFVNGYNQWASTLSTDWSLTGFVLQDLRTETAPSWDSAVTPIYGLNTADALSPQTAMVASHRTGFRGKSYNGRTYLSGWTETANDVAGRIASAAAEAVTDGFEFIDSNLDSLTGAETDRAVASRKLLVSTPIVSTTVDSEWDRQNRRKRR